MEDKNNYSIANACKYFNIDRSTYYKWEKGLFNISKNKYDYNKNLMRLYIRFINKIEKGAKVINFTLAPFYYL